MTYVSLLQLFSIKYKHIQLYRELRLIKQNAHNNGQDKNLVDKMLHIKN